MHLKLISCEIFFRELCTVLAASPNVVDVTFLPKGLHDMPSGEMRARVQAAVDATDPEIAYDAVLLGYGLCNNGLVGVAARHLPLILPRANDCITLFMGGRQRYTDYFYAHPGVYFLTSGWLERGATKGELQQFSIQHQIGMDRTYQELVDKYGKDNADFLYEQLNQQSAQHYGQYTYIEMGVEPDDRFERLSEERATARGWRYEKMAGDMGLIRRLIDGPWDGEDFLRIAPGQRIAATYANDTVVRAETPAASPA
jgi:hypothetical protein